MSAYAIAHLRSIDLNEEILVYLRKIDASLEPFEGRFLIHGAIPEVIEEPFPGAIVVEGTAPGYRAESFADKLVEQGVGG